MKTVIGLLIGNVLVLMLLKLVNQSMENIKQTLEKNNYNLTRSLGDGHCPLYSPVGHIIPSFIINSINSIFLHNYRSLLFHYYRHVCIVSLLFVFL